jgi:peptidoglycan/xylan/chitin deacetylase (PgdA/CDA1 family)
VVPDAVGGETHWEAPGAAAPLASWSELRKLVDAGWEIGLHSRSHPARLDLLTGPELELEVRGGLQRAPAQLGAAIETFAFPHGHYSDEALALIKRAGYRAALTRDPGVVRAATPRFKLPRYEIKRRDSLLEFAFLMLTGVALRRRSTLLRLFPANLKGLSRVPGRQPAPADATPIEDRTQDAA